MTIGFGARLREERERFGVTQIDIATWTGITRQSQAAFEKGQRFPDAGYLMTLITHGFDVAFLLTGQRPPRYGTADQHLLHEVFVAIDDALGARDKVVPADKKATLFALVYQSACETGQIDPSIVSKGVSLLF
jgi:transcriptional regulator with XRE-family HTH domain